MGWQGAPRGVARALAQAWRAPRGPLARGVSRRSGRVLLATWIAGVCKPDRFGPDNREMCAATCARQRCTGSCFCVGVPLPVYLEIHTGEPLPWNQTVIGLDRPLDVIGWVTVEHVQQMVTRSGTASPRLPNADAGFPVNSGCAGIPSGPHRSG